MEKKKRNLKLKKSTIQLLNAQDQQQAQGGATRLCASFRWTDPCLCVTGKAR